MTKTSHWENQKLYIIHFMFPSKCGCHFQVLTKQWWSEAFLMITQTDNIFYCPMEVGKEPLPWLRQTEWQTFFYCPFVGSLCIYTMTLRVELYSLLYSLILRRSKSKHKVVRILKTHFRLWKAFIGWYGGELCILHSPSSPDSVTRKLIVHSML